MDEITRKMENMMDDAHFPAVDGRLRQVTWEGRDDIRYLVEKPLNISCSPSDLDITSKTLPTTVTDTLQLCYRMRLVRCDDKASVPLWTSVLNALDNMSKMALIVGNTPPLSLVEDKKVHLSHPLFQPRSLNSYVPYEDDLEVNSHQLTEPAVWDFVFPLSTQKTSHQSIVTNVRSGGRWLLNPLPAYTKDCKLIHPSMYVSELRGAIVHVVFTLKHTLSANTIEAEIDRIQVIRSPRIIATSSTINGVQKSVISRSFAKP